MQAGHVVELGQRTQFVGEVVDVKAEDSVMAEGGVVEITKANPWCSRPIHRRITESATSPGRRFRSARASEAIGLRQEQTSLEFPPSTGYGGRSPPTLKLRRDESPGRASWGGRKGSSFSRPLNQWAEFTCSILNSRVRLSGPTPLFRG